MAASKQDYIPTYLGAPPACEEAPKRNVAESSGPVNSSSISFPQATEPCVQTSFKPIVIPQTSTSFRGAYFSPFARAYSPALRAHSINISVSEFLLFIDGLNEAFLAAPAFQITSLAGGVLSAVPLSATQFAGLGLQVAAGVASTATSWTRARAFVRAANERLWEPRGLRCKVCKTGEMMRVVGCGEGLLRLPGLEGGGGTDGDEPRMRRMRALGDKVAELSFEGLPPPEDPGNWWKRIGSQQAQKKDAKMNRKMARERGKGFEKYEENMRKAQRKAGKYDREIENIERDKTKEVAKVERELSGKKGRDPKDRAKIEKDLQRELRKIDKEQDQVRRKKEEEMDRGMRKGESKIQKADGKEHKVAQKIYWIVIDKADRLEQDVEEDVEDAESQKST
ncbi:hypothetical protein LHYA1_G004450 [Lachnellula hyalina]|uniref:Uncharacterized protein n=1 Tax=Lachnellula hyalina TaxID=1316788 RepID=A0A8H8R2H4_9HELO|nr:uncharacterized protein LHYA1_G004450 [Lachnellula hyalina]TVY26866.1 hypothetical protein LHYA1_G004450 [Lachnellula hyalina]